MASEQIVMGVSILVWFLIVSAMLGTAWLVVTIVNTFREVKSLKERIEAQKAKLVSMGYTVNRLTEENTFLKRELHDVKAVRNWVRDCESDDLRSEIHRLKTINETYKKQINKKEKKNNA